MGWWPGGVRSTWTLGLVPPLSRWGPGRASSVLSECGLRGQPGEAVGAARLQRVGSRGQDGCVALCLCGSVRALTEWGHAPLRRTRCPR